MNPLLLVLLLLLLTYSFFWSTEVFLNNTKFRDTPNYAFLYITSVILLAITGIGAIYGIYKTIKDWDKNG
jgi:uncharacterized membrane protein